MFLTGVIIRHSVKARFDKQVIDSAFKKIIKSKTENLEIHFVYAGYHFWTYRYENRLKSFILEGMKKYKIKKVMVTIIWMYRQQLITKEKMLDYCNEKQDAKESINDELDSFFEDLRLGKEPEKFVNTYFLPQLTEKELELVEQKDENFMRTFINGQGADVKKHEMTASESDSKFVYTWGRRRTYTIENSQQQKNFSNCSLQ